MNLGETLETLGAETGEEDAMEALTKSVYYGIMRTLTERTGMAISMVQGTGSGEAQLTLIPTPGGATAGDTLTKSEK